MADILNKKKDVYMKEKTSFLKELQSFHDNKGTPFQRFPYIGSKEIDLYLLYYLVTANGGWEKVNAFDSWDHLIQYFNLPKDCTNGAQALKYVYLRYLDQYERVHFLGEDIDRLQRDEEHEDEKRSQRRALRAFATQHVPTSYNYSQHLINATTRTGLGLSLPKEKGKDDCEKLILSLLSPMPNEQEFALNVCHLMSSEKGQGINLEVNPRIVDSLLAHAGVFTEEQTRELMSQVYKTTHRVRISNFWKYSISDKDFLELSSERIHERVGPPDIETPILEEDKEISESVDLFHPVIIPNLPNETAESQPKCKEEQVDRFKDKIEFVDAEKPKSLMGEECNHEENGPVKQNDDLQLTESDIALFSAWNCGKRDFYGLRVLQVLHIIRNLTFEEANQPILAKNLTCVRFLLLCIHSDRSELKALACEAFGNIASEFHLEDPVTSQVSAMLLGTISKGLLSQDRAIILGSLEILSKLCQIQENEIILQSALDQKICESICNYLTAHDILLLIMTLECLLSVSSLGESSCNRILNSHSSLKTLLSLLTIEAQSFGQRACINMQVIDANTGLVPVPAPTNNQTTPIKAPPPKTPASKVAIPKAAAATPMTPKQNDAESGVKSWIKTVLEPSRGSSVDLAEMHKLYAETYAKPRKVAVFTQQQLTKLIRGAFGSSVGPVRKQNSLSNDLQYMHIRLKPGTLVPKPVLPLAKAVYIDVKPPDPVQPVQNSLISVQSTPSTVSQHNVSGLQASPSAALSTPSVVKPLNSPILKAQLSVPSTPKQVVQRQQLNHRGDPQSGSAVTNGPTPVAPIVNGVMLQNQLAKEVKIEVKEELRTESKLETLLNHSEEKKNVLSDLLEKDVNGFASRKDVRIGERGLEIVLKDELASNMTARVDEEGSVQLHIEDKSFDSSELNSLQLLQQNGSSSFQHMLIEKGIIEEKPNRAKGKKRRLNVNGEEETKRRKETPISCGESSILQKAIELANIDEELLDEMEPKENGLPPPSTPSHSKLSAILHSTPRPQATSTPPIQHSVVSSTSGTNSQRVMNGPKEQELLLQQSDGTVVRVVQGLQSRQIMQQLAHSGNQGVQQNVSQLVIRDPQTGKTQIVQGVVQPQKQEQQKLKSRPEIKSPPITVSTSGSQVAVGQNQLVVSQGMLNQQQVMLNQNTNQVILGASGQQKQYLVQTSSGLQVVTGAPNHLYVQGNGQQLVLANGANGQQFFVSANSATGQQLVIGPSQSAGQQIVLANSQGQPMKFVLVNSQNPQSLVVNKNQRMTSPLPSDEGVKVNKEPLPPPLPSTQASSGARQQAPQSSKVPFTSDAAYLCEWRACMRAFRTPSDLYAHACRVHCPTSLDEGQCQWERCDDLKRKRLSLMTHLYDRHCSEDIQKRLSLRRKQIALQGKTDIPLPNLPPPHPGYAPNAAMSAIRRHALVDWGNGKDIPVSFPLYNICLF
ncbi:hypothetical protein QYM36_011633 [Artemia franciscana]|uniref:AT-rich interactive domain-containing protein 2 n=1 Tax=Artemia franciscana TaxID=6661 RepID=A0AA88HVN4_ARTSF|nr:hypothetical protein QYM36_011633 [Artemia franciscana]